MSRRDSLVARTASRLEPLLYRGGWPVRLARAMGIRPKIRIHEHTIPLLDAPSGMPALRIAYASDFHVGPTTDEAIVHAACEELRRASPDLLLLGGDFVTGTAMGIDWLAPELGTIPAPFGRMAVLGNHDLWSDAGRIASRLEAAGIQVLVNANTRLAPPFDQIWVCGLDDHWSGRPDIAAAVQGADGVRVLLMHAPSGLLDVGDERFDLALCGHTHGGQLALPGGVPIVVPQGALSRRYARGRFEIGNGATLLVSVGIGCVVLPLRTFADPEILLCTVQRRTEPVALAAEVDHG
jgi:predicted MPP superfamily phosphohydrolase